jgi:hypothetical protein
MWRRFETKVLHDEFGLAYKHTDLNPVWKDSSFHALGK